MPPASESRVDVMLKRAAIVISLGTWLATAGQAYITLPARVKQLEDLKIEANFRVLRAQNDWIVREMAKDRQIEVPDFSRFDPEQGGRHAGRN